MRMLPALIATAILGACAAQEEREKQIEEAVQAVRDFIEVRDLSAIDKMPSSSSDSWESIENHFLIYRGRKSSYLVEFSRRCYELDDDTRIVADKRWDSGHIHAKYETIRGCRIHRIYALSEAEAEEVSRLGEAPGSRN